MPGAVPGYPVHLTYSFHSTGAQVMPGQLPVNWQPSESPPHKGTGLAAVRKVVHLTGTGRVTASAQKQSMVDE